MGTNKALAIDGYDQDAFELDESIVVIVCDDKLTMNDQNAPQTIQAAECKNTSMQCNGSLLPHGTAVIKRKPRRVAKPTNSLNSSNKIAPAFVVHDSTSLPIASTPAVVTQRLSKLTSTKGKGTTAY